MTGCGHRSFLSRSGDGKSNIIFYESLSRHSVSSLKVMIHQKNINLKALGKCYSGDVAEGLNNLIEELNNNILDERYWNSIGVCYYLKRDHKKAAFFYKLSLQVAKSNNRTFSLPYNNLALIYIHTRLYSLAYDYLSNAIRLNPQGATAKFNLSQLYLKKYLPNKAIPILKELIVRSPADVELKASLGLSFLLTGKTKEALKTFDSLPKELLKRQDIASYTALSYYLSGNYIQTLETLKNQETITLRTIRKISKKLKALAHAKVKQRGQS